MHLTPAASDPQLIKGDAVPQHKGLTAFIKNNHALEDHSFHSVLPGDGNEHHTLQPQDFV